MLTCLTRCLATPHSATKSPCTGAKSAVVTDREPLALECALRSARASGISGVAADPSVDDSSSASPVPSPSKVSFPAVEFPCSADARRIRRHSRHHGSMIFAGHGNNCLQSPCPLRDDHLVPVQMQATILDWNEEYAGPKSDLVLACDVLYEASLFCPRSSPALRLFAKVSSLGSGISSWSLLLADLQVLCLAGLLCGTSRQPSTPAPKRHRTNFAGRPFRAHTPQQAWLLTPRAYVILLCDPATVVRSWLRMGHSFKDKRCENKLSHMGNVAESTLWT